MIKRTTKYIASDGTEHDSPQAAARHNLENDLYRLIEQSLPGIDAHDLVTLTTNMARDPETLRDAVDAYFEDLEEHPDSPAAQAFDDMVRYGRGVVRISPEDLVAPQGDPDDPTTWRTELPVDHPSYCRPFGSGFGWTKRREED